MKDILLIITICILIACNQESAQSLWNNASKMRLEKDLKGAVINLELIIRDFPKSQLAGKAQFELAEIFLNDIKDYDFAIEHFDKVITNHPTNEIAKNALFMKGYIYNNYLESYSEAIIHYNIFLEKYPNDDLIPSVQYEIDGLNIIQQQIDSLNSLVTKKIKS